MKNIKCIRTYDTPCSWLSCSFSVAFAPICCNVLLFFVYVINVLFVLFVLLLCPSVWIGHVLDVRSRSRSRRDIFLELDWSWNQSGPDIVLRRSRSCPTSVLLRIPG